jgi:hypothetical protein
MTRGMTKKFTSAAGIAAVLLATGCMPGRTVDDDSASTAASSGSEVNYLAQLQTAPELRIRDLPIPAGFLYKPDKSMIIEYGSVQAGILVYEGVAEPGELINYFRREMVKYDWTLVSMIEREDSKMMFQKSGRVCELTLRPSSGLSKKTLISIYYAPKEG